ncbi:MAG: hypothetical protein GC202_12665 [Alphaproteobacteria bacterium]|nr:hypothetical protein [Alphaproteobacteria bacterium]
MDKDHPAATALRKVDLLISTVISSHGLSADPPEKDLDRRKCRRLADACGDLLRDLGERLTKLHQVDIELSSKVAASKPGRKLFAALEGAGLGLDAAARRFERILGTGASENEVWAAIDAAIASLPQKPAPNAAAAATAPSQPPANSAAEPPENPLAPGGNKTAAASGLNRAPKGKA